MSDQKEVTSAKGLAASFTSIDDIIKLIAVMADSNRDALKEFAAELSYKIAHPEPTEKERAARIAMSAENVQRTKDEAEAKLRRRQSCSHRRIGANWGMFSGTSVIAWTFPCFTQRDAATGRRIADSQPVAIGVCQWCHSEFAPGDPEYSEVLSWGVQPMAGQAMMDIHTGLWQ